MVRTFSAATLAVVLSAVLFGQSSAPAFDSADVHAAPVIALGDNMSGGLLRAGRYEVRSATMIDLISLAYNLNREHVLGGPRWVDKDRFDVIAAAPANTTADAARAMLQSLLAQRFALVVRHDNGPVPVFVLSIGRGAHKMRSAGGSGAGCQPQPQSAPPAPGSVPTNVASCRGITMDAFAEMVRQMAGAYLDRPVVNQTGLDGPWDFELSWTPRGALAQAGSDGVTIFDAVDRQLGLKLEAQNTDRPVLVVVSANAQPTPNAPGIAAEPKPEFEAADIKPSAPGSQGTRFLYQPGGRINGAGTLGELVALALGIPPNLRADTLVGLPKFAETARYDLVAKTPLTGAGAATRDGARDTPPPLSVALRMFRTLLEDRFQLKTHTENRPATVYLLTAPRETRLKKADDRVRAGCRQTPSAAPATPGAAPMIVYTCQNTTVAELAAYLPQWAGGYVDHPFVDTTGLADGWDFTLSWTPRQAFANPAQGGDPAAGVASDPTGSLTLFEAIERQLGLRIQRGTHDIPVVVVDHLEEKPSDI